MTVGRINPTLISEKQQNRRNSGARQNSSGKKQQNKRDNSQDQKINTLSRKLKATQELLSLQRQKTTALNMEQRMLKTSTVMSSKDMEFVPSMMNHARGNLKADSPIFEKIARTRLDPAHAMNHCRGFSSTAKTYYVSRRSVHNINTTANVGFWFSSIPSLEVPFIYSLDAGTTFKGRWSDQVANNWHSLLTLKAEAIKSIGKSFTVRNVTAPTTQVPLMYSYRLDPAFNYPNKCDTNWCPTAAGTNVLITSAGGSADTVSVNRKVIQNIPRLPNHVSEIWDTHALGAYKVNNILDEDMRQVRLISDQAGLGDTGYGPTNVSENGVLRLGFCGEIYVDGSQYVINDNIFNPTLSATARLWSSPFMNTDITGIYVPGAPAPQSLEIECYEHYQIQTSDMDIIGSSTIEDPYDYPEYAKVIRRVQFSIPGTYPSAYNDWGAVWSWVKKQASRATDFYKDHSKVLKPALSLIPGASTALDMVEKYI